MKVYLDIDGVLANFLGSLHRVFKLPYEYEKYPYPFGLWDMFSKMHPDMPFDIINGACHESFWANLKWMHDGRRIYDTVMTHFDDIKLLTTPMPNPGSWTGKYKWVLSELGPCMAKNLIVTTTSKDIVAGPGSLLIDDRDENVEEFREAGGKAILVPRPWNKLYQLRFNTLDHIKICIDLIKEGLL
jgi:5'(3')-deoxyribonucleotidase